MVDRAAQPGRAFIKACKLIYDVVMFFVSNAARIAKFVNAVIDSVADVVHGNVGSVVNKINDVLGQMVPIIIGFFASASASAASVRRSARSSRHCRSR